MIENCPGRGRRAAQAGLDQPPGSVLGGLIIAGMVTAAIRLPIGGVLTGAWGWRTTFFINVPLALVTPAMAARWVPRDPRGQAARPATRKKTRPEKGPRPHRETDVPSALHALASWGAGPAGRVAEW